MDSSKQQPSHRKTHPPITPKNANIVNSPLNHTFPRSNSSQTTENEHIFQTPMNKVKKNTSPIPIPDQTVFDTRVTLSAAASDKKKNATSSKINGKYQPPSPPSKSPPISRLFSRTPLYTPNAQPIKVEGITNGKKHF